MRLLSIPLFSLFIGILLFRTESRTYFHSNQPPENYWTGSLSLEITMRNPAGDNSKKMVQVSFKNALPTLHRNEDTEAFDHFTDNKGTGTVMYHGEAYAGPKRYSVTDCQGAGTAELHEVVIDEAENRYSIHAIGPACTGTNTMMDGTVTPYGPEFTDIIVSEQLLTNTNMLSGTETTSTDIGGGVIVTQTIKWNLSRSKPTDVELLVFPQNYDTWLPEPGVNELTPGSQMTVTFSLRGRNGAPLSKKAKEFRLQLTGTSAEPGMTINYPVNPPSAAKPDLRFIYQQNARIDTEFQKMDIVCNSPCITGSAKIAAYDGGGYTSLTVIAILEDDSQVTGQLQVTGGITEIPIPKRNGSMIADAWKAANGNPGDYDDNDQSMGNQNDGDGLTAYEEYRGVWAEGSFKRLDPRKKELGIAISRADIPIFSPGLSWFETATDLKVIKFWRQEIHTNRRLNANYSTGHIYDQYVIPAETGTLPPMSGGMAVTPSGNPEIPARTTKLIVDVSQFQAIYQMFVQMEGTSSLPYTPDQIFAGTVAHELAHGVNVSHHGDGPNEPTPQIIDSTHRNVRIFDQHGQEILTRPYTVSGEIGLPHRQESGDIDCVMIYNPYYRWCFHQVNGKQIFVRVPPMAMAIKMCNSPNGTGINAQTASWGGDKYFGNATVGNCLSQIKLKD